MLLPEKGRSPAEQTKQVLTAGLSSLRGVDATLCMLCVEEREASRGGAGGWSRRCEGPAAGTEKRGCGGAGGDREPMAWAWSEDKGEGEESGKQVQDSGLEAG